MKSLSVIGLIAIIVAGFGVPKTALATSSFSRLATIQDQARATRESFIRMQSDREVDNASSTERFRSLEKRVLELKEQTVLIAYTRVIERLSHYTTYLDNINSRLNLRLEAHTKKNLDVSLAQEKVKMAGDLIQTASSTIALASASSTEILTSDNPAIVLQSIKEKLSESASTLEKARLAIAEAVQAVKEVEPKQ